MPHSDSENLNIPILTIITVTAYESNRLAKTLESLIAIDSLIEHLFVTPKDDSTSEEIIHQYSKKVRHTVRISRDSATGIYPAMNQGLTEASGKYLLFLNAGDKIQDSVQFESNIKELSKMQRRWGILGSSLPWNTCYSTYSGMDLKFLRQENDSYVSHQTVIVERDLLLDLKGFNPHLKIAADTLITMKLANLEAPYLFAGIAVEIESGKTVTASNRRSRLETLIAVLLLPNNRNKFAAVKNILSKEFNFLVNRMKRINYGSYN